MDAATRQLVRDRALGRCEYCRLPQSAAPYLRFHIEHIIAQQHRPDDSPENLALACPDCNRRKGPNLSTIDLATGATVRLFHPRLDDWDAHFEFRGMRIVGRTAVGRATVQLLQLNSEERVEVRGELHANGEL